MSNATCSCPWCDWHRSDPKASHLASYFVMHALSVHKVWPPLDQVDLWLMGDPAIDFKGLNPQNVTKKERRA